jgi:hypothetical protein
MSRLSVISITCLWTRAAPELVEEVFEQHDLVIGLKRLRPFHRRQHGHALAVRRQIVIRSTKPLDPNPAALPPRISRRSPLLKSFPAVRAVLGGVGSVFPTQSASGRPVTVQRWSSRKAAVVRDSRKLVLGHAALAIAAMVRVPLVGVAIRFVSSLYPSCKTLRASLHPYGFHPP